MRRILLLPLSVALVAVTGAAAPSGFLAAGTLIARPRDEDTEGRGPLLIAPQHHDSSRLILAGHRSHSSHASHSSHSSHYSGSTSGWSGDGSPSTVYAPSTPAVIPKPPQPAYVSFAAFPGGRIFVDGTLIGYDATGPIRLTAGSHVVRIENRFLGTGTSQVSLSEGQTGLVVVEW